LITPIAQWQMTRKIGFVELEAATVTADIMRFIHLLALNKLICTHNILIDGQKTT